MKSTSFYTSVVGAVLVLFIFALPAHAAVVRSGESIVLAKESVVPSDFYVAGNDVHISGDVEGDVYVLGGTVALQGKIKGDVVVLGGTVSINGPVGDDVRVIGGKVTVVEIVAGDVVMAGGSLMIVSSAKIAGDVLFYGNRMETEGSIGGTITAHAQSLSVNGAAGAIDAVVSGAFSLGAEADIKKDITYEGFMDVTRAPNASVGGTITHQDADSGESRPFEKRLPLWFMALFSALASVLLLRDHLAAMFSSHGHTLVWSGFLGLGTVLAIPIVCGLLFVSMLGMLLGACLAFLYCAALLLSFILVHVFAGALIAKVVIKKYTVNWLWAFIGVCVTQAVLLVPVVGALVVALGTVVVLGMIVYYAYVHLRV